ncbi:thioredoxin family protein [Listeria grandensis]|uniref:thioredoxin family protein n=1 Tax=Listeria grandensis TaxID=1494963 RepID=UPI00164E75AE|nr:thioredoxin family protein [Listeria grandensis]MBC6316164.1 thioredoxin family protein [Listeria grandensis]
MKKLTIIMSVILLIVLAGCSDVGIIEIEKSDEITSLLKEEKQETAYVYFGRPTCPYCQKFQPKLDSVVKEKEMKVLYYNTDEHREDNDFDKVLAEYNVDRIPYLAKVKNGKVISALIDARTEQDIIKFMK